MDHNLMALAGELPGLNAALEAITNRIEYIRGRLVTGRVVGVPQGKVQTVVQAQPLSDAKRQALEKARATLAKRRAAAQKKAKKVAVAG